MNYIVPLRRSCKELNTEALRNGYANGFNDFFLYNGRPIWHFSRRDENNTQYITYIDDTLRAKEETDYINRMDKNLEGYSKEGFMEKRLKFGAILLRTNLIRTQKLSMKLTKNGCRLSNLLIH